MSPHLKAQREIEQTERMISWREQEWQRKAEEEEQARQAEEEQKRRDEQARQEEMKKTMERVMNPWDLTLPF